MYSNGKYAITNGSRSIQLSDDIYKDFPTLKEKYTYVYRNVADAVYLLGSKAYRKTDTCDNDTVDYTHEILGIYKAPGVILSGRDVFKLCEDMQCYNRCPDNDKRLSTLALCLDDMIQLFVPCHDYPLNDILDTLSLHEIIAPNRAKIDALLPFQDPEILLGKRT